MTHPMHMQAATIVAVLATVLVSCCAIPVSITTDIQSVNPTQDQGTLSPTLDVLSKQQPSGDSLSDASVTSSGDLLDSFHHKKEAFSKHLQVLKKLAGDDPKLLPVIHNELLDITAKHILGGQAQRHTRVASSECLEAYIGGHGSGGFSQKVQVVNTCDVQRKYTVSCQDKKGVCILRHPHQREECVLCGAPTIMEDETFDPENQTPAL
eukprot:GFYU01000934.1.p1 GENE.GFYU01000934.1~~GFYU01000934.1.p1  ORF type:complete len:209 (-),score=48.78 GFYU01000934.1:271-897(-)